MLVKRFDRVVLGVLLAGAVFCVGAYAGSLRATPRIPTVQLTPYHGGCVQPIAE